MLPLRYLRRHFYALFLTRVGFQHLASALTVGGALQQDPRAWEEAVLAPEAGLAVLRPAGANGSAPGLRLLAGDPRSWERAVFSPEGAEPLLRPTSAGDRPPHLSREDISAIDAKEKAAPTKLAGIPTALVVLMAAAAAVNFTLCCALRGTRSEGLPQRDPRPPAEWPRARGSISSAGGGVLSAPRPRLRPWPAHGRRGAGPGSSSEIESQVTIEDSTPSMRTDQLTIVEAKDIVLCPLLVVPANNRCVCLVTMCATNVQQDVVIPVRGIGGANLFKIRMSESGAGGPRIQVETVDSNVLAYVSTDPLWRSGVSQPAPSPREGARGQGPSLQICWPSGRPFGCLRKAGSKAWAVQLDGREQDVLTFVGDLRGGTVNVNTLSMQAVASTSHVSLRDYRATVRAHCDAGLVILALVAIEKCEALACKENALTAGGPGETTASGSSGNADRGSTHSGSNSRTNSAANGTAGSAGSRSPEVRSDGHASDSSQRGQQRHCSDGHVSDQSIRSQHVSD
ncbi:unnamed protein product [Prorocentrum cordatum]|uniref:Anaphase-promoting complex subunit 1 n=1 Tax=Prorocentrum cordatum TaxID=2364126 RepID=A0ABN9XCN0_9DINO|nr:unnamed protein product [Polarella glacialis]